MAQTKSLKSFWVVFAATVIAAVCYFTPLLTWGMALLGLSAYLGWIEMVVLPLIGVLAGLTLIQFIRYRSS